MFAYSLLWLFFFNKLNPWPQSLVVFRAFFLASRCCIRKSFFIFFFFFFTWCFLLCNQSVLQRLKDDGEIRIPLNFIARSFFLFFKRSGERLKTRCSLEKGPADVLAYERGVVPDSCLFLIVHVWVVIQLKKNQTNLSKQTILVLKKRAIIRNARI